MAGTPTTNYSLPTYASADAPDLTGAYNRAMTLIDTRMKSNADAAASASKAASSASSTASAAKSTAESALSKAKVNEGEITKLTGRVNTLEGGLFSPSADDTVLTVQQLSGAKVTKKGIVYFKPAS